MGKILDCYHWFSAQHSRLRQNLWRWISPLLNLKNDLGDDSVGLHGDYYQKVIYFSSANGWYAVYKEEGQYYFHLPVITWKITCEIQNATEDTSASSEAVFKGKSENIEVEGLVFKNDTPQLKNVVVKASTMTGFVCFKFVLNDSLKTKPSRE